MTKVDYKAFRWDKYFWIGRLNVRWLGPEVEFLIRTDETEIPTVHRTIIEFVCNLPQSTRNKLEQFLFDKYRQEIYGTIDPGGWNAGELRPSINPLKLIQNWLLVLGRRRITPPISKPSQIWNLVSQPGIHTPPDDRITPDCCFQVTFACVWDEEHGLAVLFNDQGLPTKLGGSGSHF